MLLYFGRLAEDCLVTLLICMLNLILYGIRPWFELCHRLIFLYFSILYLQSQIDNLIRVKWCSVKWDFIMFFLFLFNNLYIKMFPKKMFRLFWVQNKFTENCIRKWFQFFCNFVSFILIGIFHLKVFRKCIEMN